MLEDQPDRLKDLKSRLKSFSFSGETFTQQERVVQIQEDLVQVASWGKSPEVKQIDAELRDLYRQFTPNNFSQQEYSTLSVQNKAVTSIPANSVNKKWRSFVIILKAFGFSVLTFVLPFIVLFVLKSDDPDFLIFFTIAIATWLGLFVFFRIAAPGVKLWFVKNTMEKQGRVAGKILGLIGGMVFGFASLTFFFGVAYILSGPIQVLFFILGMIVSPIIGVFIAISIAHQPLGR